MPNLIFTVALKYSWGDWIPQRQLFSFLRDAFQKVFLNLRCKMVGGDFKFLILRLILPLNLRHLNYTFGYNKGAKLKFHYYEIGTIIKFGALDLALWSILWRYCKIYIRCSEIGARALFIYGPREYYCRHTITNRMMS